MTTIAAQPTAQPAAAPRKARRVVPNTTLQVTQLLGTILLGGYALLSLVGAGILATQGDIVSGVMFPFAFGSACVGGFLALVFYAVMGYFVHSIALLDQIAHNAR